MTPEQASELARPARWTVQALVDKLPHVDPWWMRDAVIHLGGDRAELEARIVALMQAQQRELPRVYMGLVLFFLGHAGGKGPFLDGLRSDDARVRRLALDQFRAFRDGDLGVASATGMLPVSCEEVYTAIVALLAEPTREEGAVALDFALGHWAFDMARAQTRALLHHPTPAVRDKVLTAYLERGVDDGAIDVLARQLLHPGVDVRDQAQEWRRARWNDCRSLRHCAESAKDESVRQKAGTLALQVLESTAGASAWARLSNGDGGWLNAEELLRAVAASRVVRAASVLQAIIDQPAAPVFVRSHALLRLFEVTGRAAANASVVVDAMVRDDAPTPLDDRLARLMEAGMVTMDTLVLAAASPPWSYAATQAIQSWPRGSDDARAVSGLIEALGALGPALPLTDAAVDCVAATLHALPRTAQDDAAAIAALHMVLASAERSPDKPWIAQRVKRHLLLFGDLSVARSGGLDPWDAMWAHWKSRQWSWNDVARLLAEAGVIDPVDEGSLRGAEQSSRDMTDLFTTLLTQGGARVVFASLRDSGYEPGHHKLFGDLACAVRPPMALQALSQTWDHKLAEVPRSETKSMRYLRIVDGERQWTPLSESAIPVYSTDGTTCAVRFIHVGEVYEFIARPSGTWMDAWAVVDAFDSFMQAHGRPERAYRLADPPGWNGEFTLFLTGSGEGFAEVAARLRLPLQARGR